VKEIRVMKKTLLLCVAALVSLIPLRSDADDNSAPANASANRGIPTMAFYTKGGVIYYGYTNPGKSFNKQYSTLLASNSALGRSAGQTPTMAFYTKNGVIRYGYTAYVQSGNRSVLRPYPRDYDVAPQVSGPAPAAIGVVQTSNAAENPPANQIKMRTTTPLADRESFEQEAERTNLASGEIQIALQSTPEDAPGYYKRANAYKETNDYWDAIKDYDQVIVLDPQNAYAYYKRGLCNTALQRMDLAIEDFRKANELMNSQQPAWYQPSHTRYPQEGY